MKVPTRWRNYRPCGRIVGTRFVACKVPLCKNYNRSLTPKERFTPGDLLKEIPDIKFVIDLTYTYRYYRGELEFKENGIQYVKIKCKGREVPSEVVYRKFCEVVDRFLAETPEDCLIGVHCTHGVNRTGYLIVRYMIERLGYTPQNALKVFQRSRGHRVEREEYVKRLMSLEQNPVTDVSTRYNPLP